MPYPGPLLDRLAGWAAGRLPALLGFASIAALVELVGGGWDINYHLAQRPEVFWTPPHILLYSGALGVFAVALVVLGLLLPRFRPARPLALALALFGGGALAELAAGNLDQWWHARFGVDDALSPPHVLLTSGMVAASAGLVAALFVLPGPPAGRAPGAARRASLVVAFATLWYALWGLLFILTFPGLTVLATRVGEARALGVSGGEAMLRYLFAHPLIGEAWRRLAVAALFTTLEPLVLVLARLTLGRPWAATAVAALGTLASAVIDTLMQLAVPEARYGVDAYYLVGLVPGLLVDGAFLARRHLLPALLGAAALGGELNFIQLGRGVYFAVGDPALDPLPFSVVFAIAASGAALLALALGGRGPARLSLRRQVARGAPGDS